MQRVGYYNEIIIRNICRWRRNRIDKSLYKAPRSNEIRRAAEGSNFVRKLTLITRKSNDSLNLIINVEEASILVRYIALE